MVTTRKVVHEEATRKWSFTVSYGIWYGGISCYSTNKGMGLNNAKTSTTRCTQTANTDLLSQPLVSLPFDLLLNVTLQILLYRPIVAGDISTQKTVVFSDRDATRSKWRGSRLRKSFGLYECCVQVVQVVQPCIVALVTFMHDGGPGLFYAPWTDWLLVFC
jgi:hypothetical protein